MISISKVCSCKTIHVMEKPILRISVIIVIRILDVLQQTDKINRTSLAQKCGLSYDKTMRYVKILKTFGCIEYDIKTKSLRITNHGRKVNGSLDL